jgi:hypothetical protein
VHFIAKPFNLSLLATKVREALATPDSTAETRVEG